MKYNGGPAFPVPNDANMISAGCGPAEQEKLSDDQLINEYCKTPGLRHHVQAFIAGARYAESIIGTAKPTDSGREG